MTRPERMQKLRQARADLIRRRTRQCKDHQATAGTDRELVLVTAKLMKLEVKLEKAA